MGVGQYYKHDPPQYPHHNTTTITTIPPPVCNHRLLQQCDTHRPNAPTAQPTQCGPHRGSHTVLHLWPHPTPPGCCRQSHPGKRCTAHQVKNPGLVCDPVCEEGVREQGVHEEGDWGMVGRGHM